MSQQLLSLRHRRSDLYYYRGLRRLGALGGAAPSWVLRGDGAAAGLDIDFVNDLAYNATGGGVVSISSLLTCTRSSSGDYYTKADGTLTTFAANTLRYGTNGLLVEEARTNICLQSQTFGTTWAVATATINANQAAAPDGTTTADLWTCDGTSYSSVYQTGIVVTGSATYTTSVYAKAGNQDYLSLELRYAAGDTDTTDVVFRLSGAGTVEALDTGVTATITALANGWYLCAMTKTNPGAGTTAIVIVGASQVIGNSGPSTLNGTLYLWGAQIEAGAFATSYIPTTTTSATRAADNVQMNTSPWFNESAGTFYAANLYATHFDAGRAFTVQDVVPNPSSYITLIAPRTAGGQLYWQRDNEIAATGNILSTNAVNRMAGAYASADLAVAHNGGSLATNTNAGALSGITKLCVGSAGGASSWQNGYIRRLAYFNTRLSNSILQSLTA
jgi:hypothetical protein